MWTVDLRLVWLALALLLTLAFMLGQWSARESARRAFLQMDRASLGFLRVRPDGRYDEASPLARQWLGLPEASGFLPDAEWRPFLEEDVRAAQASGAGRSRFLALAGGQSLRWWIVPVGDALWVLVADAGEGYRSMQMLRRLLAGLAHELRTPLATMLTHLEVLKLPALAPEIRSQSMRILEEETRRMLRMVHGVLELGRLTSGEPLIVHPLSIVAVAEAAIAEKLPEAQARQQSLSLEAEEGLPLVQGDADRLKQVFLNLLDNAIRYSRPGDRILVSLRSVPEGVRCEVSDTGPGIPAEHLPYVTEPFYRGEAPEATGAGLGLAIVAEILRQHGSSLEIESRVEGETGTWIRFTLPAWRGSE